MVAPPVYRSFGRPFQRNGAGSFMTVTGVDRVSSNLSAVIAADGSLPMTPAFDSGIDKYRNQNDTPIRQAMIAVGVQDAIKQFAPDVDDVRVTSSGSGNTIQINVACTLAERDLTASATIG